MIYINDNFLEHSFPDYKIMPGLRIHFNELYEYLMMETRTVCHLVLEASHSAILTTLILGPKIT